MIIFSWRGHIRIGVFAWIISALAGFVIHPAMFIGILAPDLDSSTSKLGRWFPFWRIFGHRGLMHNAWFGVALWLLLRWKIDHYIADSFAIGYFLHIVWDPTRRKR